jgi:hypothetical protein
MAFFRLLRESVLNSFFPATGVLRIDLSRTRNNMDKERERARRLWRALHTMKERREEAKRGREAVAREKREGGED